MKNTIKYKQEFKRRFFVAFFIFSFFSFSAQKTEKYFTAAEIKKANSGSGETYLNDTEKEILLLLNLARVYPKKFLNLFKDYAGNSEKLRSNKYYSSLAEELIAMKPVHALDPDRGLFETAKCWAIEAGEKGILGHDRKNCKGGYFAECCTYGRNNALDIIMSLLIDEGVKSLGHRKICLSKSYALVGISKQPHKIFGSNTVLDFTYKSTLVSN